MNSSSLGGKRIEIIILVGVRAFLCIEKSVDKTEISR
jgi:hypothetical protein